MDIVLVCPKCGNNMKEIFSYTKKTLIANCPNCGEIKWTYTELEANHKPKETKRKLTGENYLFNR